MNHKILCMLSAVTMMAVATVHAQFFRANNNTSTLDQGVSWIGGTAPGAGGGQAIWDTNATTGAFCTNSVAAPVVWDGIQVSNTAAPVTISTGANSITIDSAFGIVVTNNQSLWIQPPLLTTADQAWTTANGQKLTLGSASRTVSVANNVTVSASTVISTNVLDVTGTGNLMITNGSTMIFNGNIKSTLVVGSSAVSGSLNQSSGTVTVSCGTAGGSAGSPNESMGIGNGGVYNISGGSLTDTTPT